MTVKTYITSLLFMLIATTALAQVTFTAKVSKKKLGVNERLRIDFEINQSGDHFKAPSFKNFDVIGGPNQTISNSWINGKRSYAKTYSFFLKPKKMGTFTIQPATAEIDGKIYQSTSVTVTVTKAVKSPGQFSAENYASDNIHLVAEVSNYNPYLNEAISVSYKLYVSANTGVSNWRETENPKYNDFWSQNIDIKGLKIKNGKYKGEDYRYVELRKTVLFPQKTGKLNIEPLTLEVSVEVPTNRRDIFGQRLTRTVRQAVSAGNRTINVKPLPVEGKPHDFTGAVGNFALSVTTSKNKLKASESLQAKVEITGTGNLKLFELPSLSTPSSLEVYEPEHNDNIRITSSGMKGRKSDTYTIVPQYKGKYPIPGISFSYFDLKTETYKTLTSNEQIINVTDGPTAGTAENNAANTKKVIVANKDQFAFIKTKTDFIPIKSNHFFKSTGFWTGVLLPLIAIPLAMVYKRRKEERNADIVGNKIRKADKLAKRYLGEAKQALGNKEAFYVALEKALHNYLKAKLTIETSDLSKDRISKLLLDKKVDAATISEFVSILENCELARYTPMASVTMQQDYDKAAKAITAIDKQMV